MSTASTPPAIRTVGRSSPKAQIIVLNKPGQQQSAVFALHLAPPKRGPDDAAINLAVQIIGGPSGRIKRNLRSSKGWSYGAGSFLVAMNGERLLATGGPVQANKTIEAMREIARELREFATSRLPTADEVSAAIHELPRANPVFIEPYEILTKLVREVVMFDLKPDYIGSYITDVRRLTPADIGRAATVLFSKRPVGWIVVGDASEFEADLRHEFGEVQVVNDESELVQGYMALIAELGKSRPLRRGSRSGTGLGMSVRGNSPCE